jgi:hypothetical protein
MSSLLDSHFEITARDLNAITSDRPPKVLLKPRQRPGRIFQRRQGDPQADVTCGDPIIYKAPGTTRFMFQSVKGLTHTTGNEDYNYYLSWMA